MELSSTKQGLFKLLQVFLLALIVFPLDAAAPQSDENYFDFLPKYRRFKTHYQIDKIEYRDKRTIIYFRNIVQEDGYTFLYSGTHPDAWYLRTPPRMQGLEIQFKLLELQNVRINNEIKMESLNHIPEVHYETKAGDVVTCEMHFVRVPNYIRMLDLIEGEEGDMDQNRLNCFDIMIKTKDSPILGSEDNADKTIERFESTSPVEVQPKVATPSNDVVADTQRQAMEEANNNTTDVMNSMPEPINYTPNQMTSINDLSCSERVILPQVHFKENEATFAGRVAAMQNINVLYVYMTRYPESRIILHGHTDIFGDAYANVELSHQRALAVKRELMVKGIDSDRIEVKYYGGSQPLPNHKSGGTENRRVEAEPICAEN